MHAADLCEAVADSVMEIILFTVFTNPLVRTKQRKRRNISKIDSLTSLKTKQ